MRVEKTMIALNGGCSDIISNPVSRESITTSQERMPPAVSLPIRAQPASGLISETDSCGSEQLSSRSELTTMLHPASHGSHPTGAPKEFDHAITYVPIRVLCFSGLFRVISGDHD